MKDGMAFKRGEVIPMPPLLVSMTIPLMPSGWWAVGVGGMCIDVSWKEVSRGHAIRSLLRAFEKVAAVLIGRRWRS
eukprot:scaffold14881_cov97-Skeletonema_dohrnii-CCMP3373.AAC.1